MFLHGYLADKNSFIYQLEFLSRDFDVYALDLKGFGENKGMEHPYSLDDYIRQVKEFCSLNGIVKPHVIAHSFGGRIALKLSSENPNFFDKMVLTGCAGLKPKRSIKYRLKVFIYKILKRFVKKEKLARFFSSDYNALSPVMKESFKLIVNEHLDYTLPKIQNKTLLIFGKDDKQTPLYMAKKLLKGIKGSRLVVYKNAGHFAFIDKPFNFNMEVKEFLL